MRTSRLTASLFCLLASLPAARGQEAKPVEIVNRAEGRRAIIKVLPGGSRVAKGEVVCELDAVDLRDDLDTQELEAKRAEAESLDARKARLLAEIALAEFDREIVSPEARNLEGEITLARSERSRARDRVKYAEDMHRAGLISDNQLKADWLAEKKAAIAVQQAEVKRSVYVRYTRPRMRDRLEEQLDGASREERDRKARLDREREKAERLGNHLDDCVLRSPIDGTLEHDRPDAKPFRPGDIVPEGRRLFRVIPPE